jgi:hypothetical protein
MMRHGIVLLLAVGLCAMPETLVAKIKREEMSWRSGNNAKVLPQFCQDRLDREGAWTKWRNHFGAVYEHVHHYCSGLYAEVKAKSALDERNRGAWLTALVSEMKYVARHCDPTCVLYADLHSRLAWAYRQQGKYPEAAKHMQLMKVAPTQAPSNPGTPKATPDIAETPGTS